MVRRTSGIASVAGLACLALALPSPALAITKKQATSAALAALAPQRQKGRVVVYTLGRALGAREVVTSADPRAPARRRFTPPGRRRWFFWMDLLNGAMFAHPSVAVTIDDRTGRVLERNRLAFYPLVDGKVPPYLRSLAAMRARRWQVYSNVPRAAKAGVAGAVAGIPGSFKPGGGNGPFAVPKSRFARDCLIEIGDNSEPFRGGYRAMRSFARDVGIRRIRARPSAAGLRRAVDRAIKGAKGREPCNDVLVYLAGHGMPPPAQGGGEAQVVVDPRYEVDGNVARNRSKGVTPKDLADLLDDHPAVDFKIKIVSCFSGRFVGPLEGKRNLRVIETSSSATHESYFDVAGAQMDDGTLVQDASENPTGADEFTNGNVHGLYDWARDQAFETANGAENDLARGIEESFARGAGQDFGRNAPGDLATDPQLKVNRRAPQGGMLQFFGPLTLFDPTEVQGVDWYFQYVPPPPGTRSARASASANPMTEIRLVMPPAGPTPRQVVNQICPAQLPRSSVATTTTVNDTLVCTDGSLPIGERFRLNVRAFPGPTPGMGAQIFGRQDGALQGPFTVTGP